MATPQRLWRLTAHGTRVPRSGQRQSVLDSPVYQQVNERTAWRRAAAYFRDLMLHASLSAFLGSLFVVLAGANVWVMLHASSRSGNDATRTRLIWAHRIGGYTFI